MCVLHIAISLKLDGTVTYIKMTAFILVTKSCAYVFFHFWKLAISVLLHSLLS